MKLPHAWFALPAAIVLMPWACFASSPAGLENPKVAADDAPAVAFAAAASTRPAARGPRAACGVASSDLCYDLADRRIVYRPARRYMPAFDGFTAESVSLRRDGIRFRYSFR